MVCFDTSCRDHLYSLLEQQQDRIEGDIDQHFSDLIFSLVLTAALCVRSSDVKAVVGITCMCILMSLCYFGQD